MPITQLTAQNVKRLEAVSITPDGKPIILTGENEAGKSTVLDCIWIALKGEIPLQPIRAGQTKAAISITIQIDGEDTEIIVERTFTSKGSYLSLKDADGKKINSPQKFIDGLLSGLALDPLAFSRMKPKEQRETLLRIAGLDLTQWERDFKEAYEARTLANREKKTAEATNDGTPEAPEGTPDEEVKLSELLEKRDAWAAKNKAFIEAEAQRDNLADKRTDMQREIEELEEKLRLKKRQLEITEKQIADFELPEQPDKSEAEKLDAQIKDSETINANVRAKKTKEEKRLALREKSKAAQSAEDKVKKLEAEKIAMLEKADFGVPDLFINDDGVIFEGKPLEQQSSARTIEISARIAMRDDSKLKILIIRDASLIGTKIFARIAEMAEEKGYQLWVERFQDQPGEQGIHIVEGNISHVDGKPAVTSKTKAEEQPEPDEEVVDI